MLVVVGSSAAMQRLARVVARVATSDAAVLIQGETGTGKELVARELHARSGARGRFVAVNCAAIPEPLLESELFGHARGAFTGAHAHRDGLFVEADGGTLFLDEIGELPIELQPKLLRALQERVVRPVGSNAEVPFSARLVTATNRDLEDAASEGRFRRDLLFRVNVMTVEVPPLRERDGDVLELARHFLERFASRSGGVALPLGAEATRALEAYPWPGNVRELENCMEHAAVLARDREVTPTDLPASVRKYRARFAKALEADVANLVTLGELERRYVRHVLERTRGNKLRAARLLGIERKTLYRKLARFAKSSAD
ncbi:MAG TPA: sigma-54 dependent transcriptional regulator [Polyangiaceae bacterium]